MTAQQYQKLLDAGFVWGELTCVVVKFGVRALPCRLIYCSCLNRLLPENLSRSWYARLEDLKKFRSEHGHSLVPKEHPANPQLVAWCQNQRAHYRAYALGKKSCMTAERVKQLEDAGFMFEVHPFRARSSRTRRGSRSLEEDKSDESEDEEEDPEMAMVAAARQAIAVTVHHDNGYCIYRDQGYHTAHAYHHHQQPHYPPPF
jgi:Helicase associated domain